MGFQLKTWNEYLALREDNARKRAIKGALAGTHTPLPGSYAACPSTNPRAMKQAQKTGVVSSDPKKLIVKEHEAKPDYSFDRWLQKASEFGDDVNKMVGKAKDDESDLDKDVDVKKKEIDQKSDNDAKDQPESKSKSDSKNQSKTVAKNKEPKPKPITKEPEPEDKDEIAKKEDTWKKLRQIHQDTLSKTSNKE